MNYFEYRAMRDPDIINLVQTRDDVCRFRWFGNWPALIVLPIKRDATKMSRDQLYHRRLQGFRIHCYATALAAREPEAAAEVSPLSFTPPNGGCRPMYASWWEYTGADGDTAEDDDEDDPNYRPGSHDIIVGVDLASAPDETTYYTLQQKTGYLHLAAHMDDKGLPS